MRLEGGCYCGSARYVAEGEPVLRGQCHCRACQHISGGAPNLFMLMPAKGFAPPFPSPDTRPGPLPVFHAQGNGAATAPAPPPCRTRPY